MRKTPKGQIDRGKGLIQCKSCRGWNYMGTIICGHGNCLYQFPTDTYIERGIGVNNNYRGVDIDKYKGAELEHTVAGSKRDERRVKKAGFQMYMDRINTSIKNSKSEKDFRRFIDIRNKQALPLYNKYK